MSEDATRPNTEENIYLKINSLMETKKDFDYIVLYLNNKLHYVNQYGFSIQVLRICSVKDNKIINIENQNCKFYQSKFLPKYQFSKVIINCVQRTSDKNMKYYDKQEKPASEIEIEKLKLKDFVKEYGKKLEIDFTNFTEQ